MSVDTIWSKVKVARNQERPTAIDLINYIFPDFIELHGDRSFQDDKAMIGGIATINEIPVTIIAEEKGKNTEDKIKRNFGMPHPEGYRKALRLIKQAEKFNRPVITIIDTPGAYPGIGAEERGQANMIAVLLKELAIIKTPIIVVILGEGGSGGALAIGVGDYIMMFENAIYSILSPEGFASILFKDSTKANEAAALMKITAEDLKKLNIIDEIIDEKDGLHIDKTYGFEKLKSSLNKKLKELSKLNPLELIENRINKYRVMGIYEEKENIDESDEN